MHKLSPTVIPNFVSKKDCFYIVNLIDNVKLANSFSEGRFKTKDRTMAMNEQDDTLKSLVLKYLDQIKTIVNDEFLFVAEYAPGKYKPPFKMPVHTDKEDREQFKTSAVLYFNNEFTGGEIYFPNIDFEYTPQKGDILIFPSGGKEFDHGVKKITSGSRYLMTMWMTDDPTKALPYLHG
jgi:hypothetical protein